MKAFTFIHPYICGIQAAIQASHSNIELMHDYADDGMVQEWAEHHKTFVWLEGQPNEVLTAARDADLPVSSFHEPALDSIATATTVVVPERLWKAADACRKASSYDFSACTSRITVTAEGRVPAKGLLDVTADGVHLVTIYQSEIDLLVLIINSRRKTL